MQCKLITLDRKSVVFSDRACVCVCVCLCHWVCVCSCVQVVIGVKHIHSRKGKMWNVCSLPLAFLQPLPPLREGFFRYLCPFCLFLSARVFRLVCIPYTHATHSPSLSRYLKTPHSGLSLSQVYFSFCSLSSFLFTPVWHLFFFMRNHETYSKLIISLTFGFTVFVSFGYSCTGSTGSSWETLPDGRLLVC